MLLSQVPILGVYAKQIRRCHIFRESSKSWMGASSNMWEEQRFPAQLLVSLITVLSQACLYTLLFFLRSCALRASPDSSGENKACPWSFWLWFLISDFSIIPIPSAFYLPNTPQNEVLFSNEGFIAFKKKKKNIISITATRSLAGKKMNEHLKLWSWTSNFLINFNVNGCNTLNSCPFNIWIF